MISERTLADAASVADELRKAGDKRAGAVAALVAQARDETVPSLDLLTTTAAGDVFGVTAQTIKNWVRAGHLLGYKVGGRIMLPRDAVMEYARRAGTSLDLE